MTIRTMHGYMGILFGLCSLGIMQGYIRITGVIGLFLDV